MPSPEEVAAELEAAERGEPADAGVVDDGRGEDGAEVGGVGPPDDARRHPSTIGGVFYLMVLAATAIGIAVTWSGEWRSGVRWVAGALVAAASLRLVLPARDAGMLKVRHRLFDVLLLGAVGVTLFVLAATIPDQPL